MDMSDMGISVIMPSLNVKNYIEECLCSVLSQSYQNMEVLVVDAGSTDGTKEIIQKYEQIDSRIKLINSEKKSYGYQMNLGIEKAAGRFIAFVETDDVLAEGVYEKLLSVAEKTDADFVKGIPELFWGTYRGAVWTKRAYSFYDSIDPKVHGNQMVVWPKDMPALLRSDLFLWTGLYKREFIQTIRLNETAGAAFQDQGFLLKTLSQAEKGVYVNFVSYKYRQSNPGSSIVNPNGFRYLAMEYKLNEEYVKTLSVEWQKAFYRRLWVQCIERFRCMARNGRFWETEMSYMAEIKEMLDDQWALGMIQKTDWLEYEAETYELFARNPLNLYQKFSSDLQGYAKALHQLDQCFSGKKVVIFGCGKVGRFLHLLCDLRKPGAVAAYCDNSDKNIGTTVQGIPVYSPQQTVKKWDKCIIALAGRRYEKEMKQQLKSLGVPDTRIFVYSSGINEELLKIEKKPGN